jgi:biotin-dependent carboxylase-like uncharacterized protein
LSALVAVSPGFLTTVQDLGRPGFAAIGVSASGAADPIALRLGNRLVGNDESAAALEMTLVGGSFRFEAGGVVALTGADPSAKCDGRVLAPWAAHRLAAGREIACGPLRRGARGYLCVRGGIDTRPTLGSRSTHLASALGGLDGRPLRAGDRLPLGTALAGDPRSGPIDPAGVPGYVSGDPLRATSGPQAAWFPAEVRERFYEASWIVAEASDRMGIRLEGPLLEGNGPRELVTEGVCLGAVQVPPGGSPIVLFVEHQTTGGYPKIANVIGADLARLGQLRPRDRLRVAPVSLDDAVNALRAQEGALRELGR